VGKSLRKKTRKKIVVEKRKFDQLLGKLIDTKPAPKESIKTGKKKPAKLIMWEGT
jgi:hypothetical protein